MTVTEELVESCNNLIDYVIDHEKMIDRGRILDVLNGLRSEIDVEEDE